MMHRESGSYFHFLLGGWLTSKYMPIFREFSRSSIHFVSIESEHACS